MTKFALLFVVLVFVFTTTMVVAKNDNANNGNGNGNSGQSENRGQGNSTIGASALTAEEIAAQTNTTSKKGKSKVGTDSANPNEACDPALEYKNHGEYVKCVAKLGLGGKVVSQAARSDIGKKNASGSGTVSPSPIASGSAQPSPEGTGSATPSAEPSPEATNSGLLTGAASAIIDQIKELFAQFQALFSL